MTKEDLLRSHLAVPFICSKSCLMFTRCCNLATRWYPDHCWKAITCTR